MHGKISETAALLALALLAYADDEGRFKVQFKGIVGQLFTFRELKLPIEQAYAELVAVKFLTPYEAMVDGHKTELCQITTFKRHQSINKPVRSRFPAPSPESSGSTTGELPESSGSTTGELPESSGSTPGTLPEDSRGKEGRKGVEGRREGEPIPPTLEEVLSFGDFRQIPEECARKWFLDQKKVGWKHKGQAITDWRSGLESYASVWRREAARYGQAEVRPSDLDQLEAELEAEADPDKRRALKEKIKKARG